MSSLKFPKPKREKKGRKGVRKVSNSRMTIKLDDLVRQIFRKKWEPVCFICGRRGIWGGENGIQVGHYISRKVFNLRWDFHNLYPNCPTCNSLHEYYQEPFRKAILDAYGSERLEYIDRKYKEHLNMTSLVKIKDKLELYDRLTLVNDKIKYT